MVAWFLFCLLSLRSGNSERCDIRSRLLHQFPNTTYAVLSPDGRKLAGITQNRQVAAIWDIESEELLYQLPIPFNRFTATSDNPEVAWSPDGTRLLLTGNRTLVVTATLTVLLNLNVYSIKGAWSPSGDMFLLIAETTSSHMYPVRTYQVRDAISGEITAHWDTPSSTATISWSPAALMAVHEGVYYLNGSLSYPLWFESDLIARPRSKLTSPSIVSWGSNNTMAVRFDLKIILLNASGSITHVEPNIPRMSTFAWSENGMLLAYCAPRCIIRDRLSFAVVLDIGMVSSQDTVLSLSNERSLLVTMPTGGSTVYVWSTHMSSIREFPLLPSPTQLSWNDRDSLRLQSCFTYNCTRAEINVRKLETKFLQWPMGCEVESEQFWILGNGTVQVSKQGRIVRQWNDRPSAWLSCSSYEALIATYTGNEVVIWDKDGVLISKINSTGAKGNVEFVNPTVIAMFGSISGNIYPLFLVFSNPNQRVRQITSTKPWESLKWSRDGSWLATSTGTDWAVFDREGKLVRSGQPGGTPLWRAKFNTILLISTSVSRFLYVDLEQPSDFTLTFEERACTSEGVWNPYTLEVICLSDTKMILWKPILSELQGLTASNNVVGANATFQVTALTGLLPFPQRAMIRWIDTSTSTAKCLFVSVELPMAPAENLITLEPVKLPQPGLYTVYLPGLPWVGSDHAYVTVSCPEPTKPFISPDGPTSCVCPSSMYVLTAEPIQCEVCPIHGVCDGTSLVTSRKGFWITNDKQFLACATGACIGNNSCGLLYHGPLCGLCVPDAGQHGFGRCQHCHKPADAAFVAFGFLFWIVLCVFQSLFALGWKSGPNSHRNNSAQLAAILVSTVQTNALLLSLHVDLDIMYHSLGYVEEFSQNGVPSAAVSCLLLNAGFTSGTIHYIKQVIVVILPLLAWVMLKALRGIFTCCGVGSDINIVRVPTVVVWASLQTYTYTLVLQTLDCTRIDSEVYRLRHDLSVICYTTRYWWFLGLVTIPTILASLIVPVWIFWLLRFHSTERSSGHLRFLVKSYRADWWFLVIITRKVILSILVTWTRNPFFIAFCLALACILQVVTSPSTSHDVNVAETISLLSSIFIFSVAGALNFDDSFQTYQQGVYIVLTVAAMSYLLQISLLIYNRIWSAKAGKMKAGELYMRIDSPWEKD